MRSNTTLLIAIFILLTWCGAFAKSDAIVRVTNSGANNFRYLRGSKTATTAENIAIKPQDEERLSIPGLSKFKDALQKNPTFVKSLEKFRQKRQSLKEFFAENPVIKKDVIIVSVLLSLIVTVPLVVKSFYPA
ncbi:Secreted RxLR effector peptide protein [Phytophthora palmivora]|uniref:Secreted RxLR effector peptide protein n=1 Tax=Phytophthora palmivora TaxID=4796 RepID=A0A2P4XUA3_9STRA|nr:Secreted RxLR effector peptide protein [Phytophthora palmivora]